MDRYNAAGVVGFEVAQIFDCNTPLARVERPQIKIEIFSIGPNIDVFDPGLSPSKSGLDTPSTNGSGQSGGPASRSGEGLPSREQRQFQQIQ